MQAKKAVAPKLLLLLLLFCTCTCTTASGAVRSGEAASVKDFELVEGDIQVPRGAGRDGEALSASSVSRHSQLWAGGQVRYIVDTAALWDGVTPLSADDVRITRAVANWEAKTCLRFTLCTSEADCELPYVKFVASIGCSSPLGALSTRPNTIYLAPGCSMGSAVHELGHSFGLMHEQTRRDRDEYVIVDYDNVISGYASQFNKMGSYNGRSLGAYDYGSIMHYNAEAFSSNGAPTIIAPETIGQSAGLSAGDVEAIDFMYNGCSAEYARPTCMGSVDATQAHVIPHSKPWDMDFNVMYAASKSVVVTYEGTTAPAGQVAYSKASGSNIGSIAYTGVTFTPSPALAGQTFTLSATFTGSELNGPATTCAVTVRVATAHLVCFGVDANDANVCSGHGTCVEDAIRPCQCAAGYAGVDCSGTVTCPRDYTTSFDRELSWWPFGTNPVTEDSSLFVAGGGSMRAGDVGSADRGQARLNVADSEPHTVTFHMAVMSGPQATPALRLRRGTKTCAVLQRYSTGEWGVGGSRLTGVAHPETERFYAVRMDLDWAASQYTVSIDGVEVATAGIRSECAGGMDVAIFFGNGWLDEFEMSCTTRPPSSVATIAPSAPPVTTDAPATDAPATKAPATDAPATSAPSTDAPATKAPATDTPATDAPPATNPPTPTTDAPAAPVPLPLPLPPTTLPGLTTSVYKTAGTMEDFPDFEALTPLHVVVSDRVVFRNRHWKAIDATLVDDFAATLEGFLRVEVAGEYTLHMKSSDGSLLWLDDELVIENGGVHGVLTKSVTLQLSAGLHDLEIHFFEHVSKATLKLEWTLPTGVKQNVPAEHLSH